MTFKIMTLTIHLLNRVVQQGLLNMSHMFNYWLRDPQIQVSNIFQSTTIISSQLVQKSNLFNKKVIVLVPAVCKQSHRNVHFTDIALSLRIARHHFGQTDVQFPYNNNDLYKINHLDNTDDFSQVAFPWLKHWHIPDDIRTPFYEWKRHS